LFKTVNGQSVFKLTIASGDIFEFRDTSLAIIDTTVDLGCVESLNQNRPFREEKLCYGDEHSRERRLADLVKKKKLEDITSGVVEDDEQEIRP